MSRRKTVGFVQQHHHTAHSGRRNERSKELPLLLFARRRAEPITDFQVGDKRTCHSQCRADHTAHNQRSHHTARAFQTDANHHDRSQNQRHQRHSRHGIRADDGDGVGRDGRKEECDDRNERNCDECLEYIAVHHTEPEEQERDDQRHNRGNGDELKRQVFLGALRVRRNVAAAALHLLRSQSDSTLDDAPRLDDSDDTSHCDATDANRLAVSLENILGRHIANRRRDARIPLVQHRVGEEQCQSRYNQPPHRQRTQADNQRILKTDDIAQTEHRSARVHLENEFRIVGQLLSPTHDTRREILVPPAESRHEKVVESAHDSSQQQRFGLVATLRTRNQHLRRRRGFREGVFSVHLAHEIFSERNQEQNADDAAEQRRNEDFDKRSRHFGVFRLQNVDGGQRENRSGHYRTRTRTNRLDDDVLAECLRAFCRCGNAHRDNRNRNGRFEHLSDLQSQISRSRRKEHCHQHAPRHRPRVHLRIITFGRHQRFVPFALFQLSKRIFRQSHRQFVLFVHIV